MTEAAENYYVGGERLEDDDADLSALDRGDALELTDTGHEVAPAQPDEINKAPPETGQTPPETEEESDAEELQEAGEQDADEEAPAEPVEPEKPAENRIPKSRFDEVNNRRKAAEQRVRELEERMQAMRGEMKDISDFDFEAKEREALELAVDGEFEKATKVRAEIREAERALFMQQAAQIKQEAVQATQGEITFKAAVQELEALYPQFNVNDEGNFDGAATEEALQLHRFLLSQGSFASPGDSLREAVRVTALRYGYAPVTQEEAPPGTAPPVQQPRRKAVSQRAKQQHAQQQPRFPASGSAAADPGPRSILDLTEEEFDALPEAKKRELRGDLMD